MLYIYMLGLGKHTPLQSTFHLSDLVRRWLYRGLHHRDSVCAVGWVGLRDAGRQLAQPHLQPARAGDYNRLLRGPRQLLHR